MQELPVDGIRSVSVSESAPRISDILSMSKSTVLYVLLSQRVGSPSLQIVSVTTLLLSRRTGGITMLKGVFINNTAQLQ